MTSNTPGHRESTGAKRWLEENVSKKQIQPWLEHLTGVYPAQGEKPTGLDVAMNMPLAGGIMRGGKALAPIIKAGKSMYSKWKGGKAVASTIAKTSQVSKPRPVSAVHHSGKEIGKVKDVYPEVVYNPKAISRPMGMPEHVRDVAMVKMTNKGKDWWQPFYKSSGTSKGGKVDLASGKTAGRKDTWEPFLGKSELKTQSRSLTYSDPISGKSFSSPHRGWFQKGWFQGPGGAKAKQHRFGATSGDKYKKPGMGIDESDIASRTGPYKQVSQELSRLESKGFFKRVPKRRLGHSNISENPFLKSFGLDRPISDTRKLGGGY